MHASDPLLAPLAGTERRDVGGVQIEVAGRAGEARVKAHRHASPGSAGPRT